MKSRQRWSAEGPVANLAPPLTRGEHRLLGEWIRFHLQVEAYAQRVLPPKGLEILRFDAPIIVLGKGACELFRPLILKHLQTREPLCVEGHLCIFDTEFAIIAEQIFAIERG